MEIVLCFDCSVEALPLHRQLRADAEGFVVQIAKAAAEAKRVKESDVRVAAVCFRDYYFQQSLDDMYAATDFGDAKAAAAFVAGQRLSVNGAPGASAFEYLFGIVDGLPWSAADVHKVAVLFTATAPYQYGMVIGAPHWKIGFTELVRGKRLCVVPVVVGRKERAREFGRFVARMGNMEDAVEFAMDSVARNVKQFVAAWNGNREHVPDDYGLLDDNLAGDQLYTVAGQSVRLNVVRTDVVARKTKIDVTKPVRFVMLVTNDFDITTATRILTGTPLQRSDSVGVTVTRILDGVPVRVQVCTHCVETTGVASLVSYFDSMNSYAFTFYVFCFKDDPGEPNPILDLLVPLRLFPSARVSNTKNLVLASISPGRRFIVHTAEEQCSKLRLDLHFVENEAEVSRETHFDRLIASVLF